MVEVEFLGPIGKKPMSLDVSTLNDAKEQLKLESELDEWLSSSAIALNDKIVDTLEVELKDGDRISLLPPVCGG